MRTEREIRKQLSRIRYLLKNQKKPKLWRTMELQIYENQLMWVLKEKPKSKSVAGLTGNDRAATKAKAPGAES